MSKATFNFDGLQVVKWAAGPLIHRHDVSRRRKIIGMARECACRLKVAGWSIIPWDPSFLTMDYLEILAASKECSTLEGATQVAWLLGDNDIIRERVVNHVLPHFESKHDFTGPETDVAEDFFCGLDKARHKLRVFLAERNGASCARPFCTSLILTTGTLSPMAY